MRLLMVLHSHATQAGVTTRRPSSSCLTPHPVAKDPAAGQESLQPPARGDAQPAAAVAAGLLHGPCSPPPGLRRCPQVLQSLDNSTIRPGNDRQSQLSVCWPSALSTGGGMSGCRRQQSVTPPSELPTIYWQTCISLHMSCGLCAAWWLLWKAPGGSIGTGAASGAMAAAAAAAPAVSSHQLPRACRAPIALQ